MLSYSSCREPSHRELPGVCIQLAHMSAPGSVLLMALGVTSLRGEILVKSLTDQAKGVGCSLLFFTLWFCDDTLSQRGGSRGRM